MAVSICRCAVDVDVDVDVDGQSTGGDLHNHRQRSKTQHRINTQKARIRQMGEAEDAKREVESGQSDLHESSNK